MTVFEIAVFCEDPAERARAADVLRRELILTTAADCIAAERQNVDDVIQFFLSSKAIKAPSRREWEKTANRLKARYEAEPGAAKKDLQTVLNAVDKAFIEEITKDINDALQTVERTAPGDLPAFFLYRLIAAQAAYIDIKKLEPVLNDVLDRISGRVYLYNRRPQYYIMPNNKLANAITNPELFTHGGGALIVARERGRSPEITTNVLIQDIESRAKLSEPLTEFDRALYNAICSIYRESDGVFTAQTLYRVLIGAAGKEKKITGAQITGVEKSLQKMARIVVEIDAERELKYNKNAPGDIAAFGGNLLALEWITVRTQRGLKKGYRITAEPLLMKYAAAVNQILHIKAEYLSIKDQTGADIALTDKRIIMRDRLIRAVEGIKAGRRNPNIIVNNVLEGIEPAGDHRARAVVFIRDTLQYWKKARYIANFSEITENGALKAFSIKTGGK